MIWDPKMLLLCVLSIVLFLKLFDQSNFSHSIFYERCCISASLFKTNLQYRLGCLYNCTNRGLNVVINIGGELFRNYFLASVLSWALVPPFTGPLPFRLWATLLKKCIANCWLAVLHIKSSGISVLRFCMLGSFGALGPGCCAGILTRDMYTW